MTSPPASLALARWLCAGISEVSSTSASHTTFTVGSAGSFTVTTNAGFPTATALAETGALPNGVTFQDNGDGTATQSGTPAAGTDGSYPLTITASAAGGATPPATQSFTLTVNPAQIAPTIHVPADITTKESPAGSGSATVTFTVTADGTPTPTIVCLDGTTPVQPGDSFTVGVHTIQCTATNSAGTANGTFKITVNAVVGVVTATAGNNQAVAPGAAFPTNLAATVTDSPAPRCPA